MAVMGRYCKAYPAGQLRVFPGWTEKTPPARVSKAKRDGEPASSDGSDELEFYYIQQNYTVTAGIFRDEQITFDNVTDDWKKFCHEKLQFDPSPHLGDESPKAT